MLRKGEMELYISPFILDEMKVVLREDFGWSEQDIQEIVEELTARAILVEPKIKVSAIKEKEADNRILEYAVEGDAQYIISGDKHQLQPLKEYQGVRLLSPEEFLRI